jgi:magnesium transporter
MKAITTTSRRSIKSLILRFGVVMLASYPRSWKTGRLHGVWIDLLDPTEEEKSAVEQSFGLRVPTKDELSEIETTSRLRAEQAALYMSAPLISIAENGAWLPAPTGFVLSKEVLITVHFEPLAVLQSVAEQLARKDPVPPAEVFTLILEAVVDRAADHLELSAERLDGASKVIFQEEHMQAASHSYDARMLRNTMTHIGRISERVSNTQYMLTWIDRICNFTSEHCRGWVAPEILARLQAVRSDTVSLTQFDESLLNRVQLLQDAATAIINIGQNEVMKVLTVVSVAGVPPILIAGIYGMNFKNMPELNWPWGYGFALALIVISTVIPLVWFKLKRWI